MTPVMFLTRFLSPLLFTIQELNAGLQDWNLRSYHQLDYDLTLDIARIVDYNRDLLRDPQLEAVWYNRTRRVLNGSVWVLKESSRDLLLRFQLFKLSSNEYRYFPLDVQIKVCDEWERNLFNIQELAAKMSNARECPPKKGFYYVKHGQMEIEKLPPLIPAGSYKSLITIHFGKVFVAQIESYGRVLDKPNGASVGHSRKKQN